MNLITKQIQGVLENAIFNKIIAQNLKIPNATLRAIVSRVAEQSAVFISSGVFNAANTQLDVIPKNILGSVNPVNILNANLSSINLTSNLNNIIGTQISSQATDKIVSLLEGELRRALPADKLGLINFTGLSAILVQSLTPTIGGVINTALSSFSDSLFKGGITPPINIPGITNIFSSQPDSDKALTAVQDQLTTTLSNKALQESQQFDINNTDNQEKLTVLKQGFTDPNANYPTKDYAEAPETNKLARGDIRGTVVQKKNSSRMLGAKLPGSDSWDQPISPFKGKYPYNKVTETESGHIIEVDDTPGAERLHVYHKSGTFIEIDSNGSVVKRAVGSSYEIIDRNGRIAIAGKADISINGACNIFVGNDANIEVEGDTNIVCHNDITAQAGGKLNLSAKEEVNITGGNVNFEAYHTMNNKANVAYNIHSSNVIHMHSNVDIKVQGADLYTKASGTIYTQAEGAYNVLAAGDVNIDGDLIYWNSDTAQESQDSVIAESSKIGVLEGRKDIFDNSKVDPLFLTLADTKSLLLEEEGQTSTDFNTQKDLIITSGYGTAADVDASPLVLERTDVSTTQSQTVPADEKLRTVTELPGNYNLSPNFTLEMLSNKAAVTTDIIQGRDQISYGEIVYNLQAMALNILEPVYKIYPNMFVTSAYRKPGTNATSQHPLGQAVDIQFKGVSKSDYYEIAQQLGRVLNYDQLILEFCNYTKNPWIHISYSVKNRNQVLTFFNHRKHSDGLTQLA